MQVSNKITYKITLIAEERCTALIHIHTCFPHSSTGLQQDHLQDHADRGGALHGAHRRLQRLRQGAQLLHAVGLQGQVQRVAGLCAPVVSGMAGGMNFDIPSPSTFRGMSSDPLPLPPHTHTQLNSGERGPRDSAVG